MVLFRPAAAVSQAAVISGLALGYRIIRHALRAGEPLSVTEKQVIVFQF